jgi:hypothetical protein
MPLGKATPCAMTFLLAGQICLVAYSKHTNAMELDIERAEQKS